MPNAFVESGDAAQIEGLRSEVPAFVYSLQ